MEQGTVPVLPAEKKPIPRGGMDGKTQVGSEEERKFRRWLASLII
jgi:hypothetical protein